MKWQRTGNFLYILQSAGWKNNVEQFENRLTIKVDGKDKAAVEEMAKRLERLLNVTNNALVEAANNALALGNE